MPTIMHTSPDVTEIFEAKLKEMGLEIEAAPAAIKLLVPVLSNAAAQYAVLGDDLPSAMRFFDWMSAAFSAYAEWCERTIVVDAEETV